ncbi:hypothetical protein [Aquimarina algicola]|uniref:Uncharacterized protein n=1 Tax=Aquimarina algicola TaxID=2589995 RepID=A0A504JLE5_9FLAO|nr:hypothetical protein [Aquimarina algicola]TPN87569.1 hypothetical protein FHK87_08285 [Aquimarina algicola]
MKYYSIKTILIVILSFFIFNSSSGQELKKEHKDVVLIFVNCIKNHNLEKLQNLISYPLKREYPLPDIKDETDFINWYSEVFDDHLINEIIKSNLDKDWSAVGWRGIMLNNGTLWLDYEGKLLGVNYQSDAERTKIKKLIEIDRSSVHQTLKKYRQPVIILETKKFRVRIDELENETYRYASWSINSKMSEKPDLIIKSRKLFFEGSGGNHRYEFNNGNYKYVCSINIIGAMDTPPADLLIYENEKEILSQPAQIVNYFESDTKNIGK